MNEYISVFSRGMMLGSLVMIISRIMDLTVSIKTYLSMKSNDIELYNQGLRANIVNLMVLTPLFYSALITSFTRNSVYSINEIYIFEVFWLTFIHNLLYYTFHRSMHQYVILRDIHDFHHKFDRLMLPSVGNAVTKREFIISYVSPLFVGAYIIHPSEISLICSIGSITILNLIIHCKEMEHLVWIPFFVSPKKHIEHHVVRTKHYSAPLLDFDEFLDPETYK